MISCAVKIFIIDVTAENDTPFIIDPQVFHTWNKANIPQSRVASIRLVRIMTGDYLGKDAREPVPAIGDGS